jgi:hypothetical protein
MISDSALIKKIENIQLILREEIKNSEQELCGKSIQQLKTIHDELEYMKIKKGFKPDFPRFIIDSWNFDDELGQDLMGFLTIYKKLK